MTITATQLQHAYGVPAMLAAGTTGASTTTVPHTNPRAAYDLAVYSRQHAGPAAHPAAGVPHERAAA